MAKKKLKLSKDGMLCGVCSGIAEYTNTEVTLVRIAFLMVAFTTGFGVVPYFLLYFILPE